MYDKFRHVEEEYYKLRGRFSVGRLSESEFDAALHDLVIQDPQGQYWMIGANTGNWYFYDGADWVEGNPYRVGTRMSPPPQENTAASEPTSVAPIQESPSGRGLALPFLASGLILLIVAALAYFVFNIQSADLVSADALPTRIAPITFVALEPTGWPTPTATPSRTATLNPNATQQPVTETPKVLVIEPTKTGPALTTIPTITPGAAVSNDASAQAELDETAFTDASPESNIDTALPPDVYVTNLQVSPNPPRQRQEITFTATFLNTNPQPVGMEWRVVFLNLAKQGRNKDWGQSQLVGINLPPGSSQFSLVYIPVTSSGPCVTLQALVARRLLDNGRFFLPNTNRGNFATMLTFC